MKRMTTLLEALYRLYEHSGFAMAGAVAFSFVVSLFPFCIFLGALSGIFGGRELANQAIAQLFQVLPEAVAKGLVPQVEAIMGASRIDLLTVSGFVALFFATSAIETLRAALNGAYRVHETRPYPFCLLISMTFVLISAVSMLLLTWVVVVGPAVAAKITKLEPDWANAILNSSWFALIPVEATWFAFIKRYALSGIVITGLLLAFHLWLAAGKRRLADVWPGVLLSVALWLGVASVYSFYLNISDYSRFYAGLSQLMVALIFFQFTAITIILGAEFNRGVAEIKRISRNGLSRRSYAEIDVNREARQSS